MRSFAIIATIFAVASAQWEETENNMMDATWEQQDWDMDMDHDMNHDMDQGDWGEMECMLGGEWACDSASALGATMTAIAVSATILM